MKTALHQKFSAILVIFGLILTISVLIGCSEDPTPSLYTLAKPTGDPPVITALDPPGGALAGVTEVTITGQNFSPSPEDNFVYFKDVRATVLQASAAQLVVRAPAVTIPIDSVDGVSYSVKMWVFNLENRVEEYSNTYVYKLKNAVSNLFDFSENQIPYGLTTDAAENVYVSLQAVTSAGIAGVKKITPDRELFDYAPRGSETFWPAIKYGPNNEIYTILTSGSGSSAIFKLPGEGVAPERFVVGNPLRKINDIDFDQNDNLWAAGSEGIFRLKQDKDVKVFTSDVSANSARVFESYLYLAGSTSSEKGVWRREIVNTDSLGNPENYFDFTTVLGDSADITAITFAADGDLYLGTTLTDPIVVVHPDKSYETLYPGLIKPPVYAFAWGTGNFLYYTREKSGEPETPSYLPQTIIKIDMQKTGAPYYGRD